MTTLRMFAAALLLPTMALAVLALVIASFVLRRHRQARRPRRSGDARNAVLRNTR